jgi:hypothetical protein
MDNLAQSMPNIPIPATPGGPRGAAAPGGSGGVDGGLPHDIRPLAAYGASPWPWVAGALVLLAAIVALVLWRKRRKRPAPVVAPEDPWSRLRRKLDALSQPPFATLARREQRDRAFAVSMLVREAVELASGLPATEQTLAELTASLRTRAPLATADTTTLIAQLERLDAVKFGDAPWSAEAARGDFELAAGWLDKLRPRLRPDGAANGTGGAPASSTADAPRAREGTTHAVR